MKTTWIKKTMLLVMGMGMLSIAACASDGVAGGDTGLEPEDLAPLPDSDKGDAWDSANNPAHVDTGFLYITSQLPLSGSGPEPIPGSYWPVADDNINVKWNGEASPAEKYAKAFGKNVADVQDAVSAANGVKGHTERKACTVDADCSDQNDGSVCASSYDGKDKRCIPTWWGICHGWSPYAISEAPAKMAVTMNGVTFQPGDIEALMSLVYTNVDSKFLASRCNRGSDGDYAITHDNSGRENESECRDMNPGSWHILVTNMMGLRHQGFVLDQTTSAEVWNQPAWKYQITNAENGVLKEISKTDALSILGAGQTMTELFPSADLAKSAQKTGVYTSTVAGIIHFKLTGTGDSDLYLRKNAELDGSTYDCKSDGTTSIENCDLTVAVGDQVYWLVAGYADTSNVTLGVGIPGMAGGTYTYNPAATKFWYVEMDFTFIVENGPADAGAPGSSSQQTKHYTYVLEGDDFGKIVGGEWSGASMDDHPDFAWWPTAKASGEVADVDYADVKALNDLAAGAAPVSNTTKLLDNAALPFTTSTRSKYIAITVETGVTSITVDMTGTGDASLLVGPKGQYPRVGWSMNLCEQKTPGTSTETCTFKPPASGTYYVRARAEVANTVVTVTATKSH